MGSQYNYIQVRREDKRYFCLQQNTFSLAWLLFFRKNTLLPMTVENVVKRGLLKRAIGVIRRQYYTCSNNIETIINFVIVKYNSRKSELSVELPFYGQVCMLVNKGYKIIDLRRGVTIKVFRDDVDIPAITNEMQCLQKGNLFDFAPSIRRMNINERWYEEEYIDGDRDYSAKPRNSSEIMKKFQEEIIPCLERLIFHQSLMTKHIKDYVDEIRSILSCDNSLREKSNAQYLEKIIAFIDSIAEQLRSKGDLPVYLALTHGDFCPANMLNTKRGLIILDWESATYRSALFDFYSYFFFRSVHQKLPVDKLNNEIKVALPFFVSKLDSMAPDISRNLKTFEEVYRWLYYIERVSMLMEREKHDTKHNIFEVILRFIEVFKTYEDINTEKLTCSNL
ncbi:MAG: hypothetical protein C4538_04545 [Nitrospiraceae bacterium]|nr:MAG: hypothetical protein C4538_04545 [Nitrospiraceae bacterium]